MLPYLNRLNRGQNVTVDLQGLNLTGTVADGEWAYTRNMDAVLSPIIARREKRALLGRLEKPNGLQATDKLCFVDGKKFYYNGWHRGNVVDGPKQLVPMGSRICIFPDKVFFDTKSYTFTRMEQRNITRGNVQVTLARADGKAFDRYTTGEKAPAEPANGQLWLDTSGDVAVMKSWVEMTGMWVEENTTYVCVTAAGIGEGLKEGDGVKVEGLTVEGLDGEWLLSAAARDRIIFTGIIAEVHNQTEPVTVSRTCPDMDFVVEWQNRLWGCSSKAHEIYACSLGDPTNWRQYSGLASDSYALPIGSAGDFTGAATLNGSVVFFKESCIHKIYGSMPANYQLETDHFRGVASGCSASLVRINELLYYKSVFDVCVYDGVQVASISAQLGKTRYKKAVAGSNDRWMYISMQDDTQAWHLMVYDTVTRMWMREDETHALAFAQCESKTLMLTESGEVWEVKADTNRWGSYPLGGDYAPEPVEEKDEDIRWCLRTGEMLSMVPGNKTVSKMQLLLELSAGAEATVRIRKDNEAWQTAMHIMARDKRRYTLPIYPKRCDRMQVEIAGVGEAKLLGMSRMVENGSEYGR